MQYDILVRSLGNGVYEVRAVTEAGTGYFGSQTVVMGYIPVREFIIKATTDGLRVQKQ